MRHLACKWVESHGTSGSAGGTSLGFSHRETKVPDKSCFTCSCNLFLKFTVHAFLIRTKIQYNMSEESGIKRTEQCSGRPDELLLFPEGQCSSDRCSDPQSDSG